MREIRGHSAEPEWSESEQVATRPHLPAYQQSPRRRSSTVPPEIPALARSGIGSKISNIQYKQFIDNAINSWNSIGEAERIKVLERAVQRQLECVGVPPCEIKVGTHKENAATPVVFNALYWTLFVGFDFRAAATPERIRELFLVTLHELRHVEQKFRIARYQLWKLHNNWKKNGSGNSMKDEEFWKMQINSVSTLAEVARPIAEKAVTAPLGGPLAENSPEMLEILPGTLDFYRPENAGAVTKTKQRRELAKQNLLVAIQNYEQISKKYGAASDQSQKAYEQILTSDDALVRIHHESGWGEADAQQSVILFLEEYYPELLTKKHHEVYPVFTKMTIDRELFFIRQRAAKP